MSAGIASVLAAYLIGGIPFGLLLYRAVSGGDIRGVGSGNIGATNVARALGWRIGVITLLFDAGKGAAAVLIGRAVTGDPGWASAAGLGAVAGHCFPLFLSFRGGKGVATGCGAFAVLHPAAMGVALVIFAAAVALTRMVSAGSILGALAFPAATTLMGSPAALSLCSAAASALVVARHGGNIRRIAAGRERRIGGGPGEERS